MTKAWQADARQEGQYREREAALKRESRKPQGNPPQMLQVVWLGCGLAAMSGSGAEGRGEEPGGRSQLATLNALPSAWSRSTLGRQPGTRSPHVRLPGPPFKGTDCSVVLTTGFCSGRQTAQASPHPDRAAAARTKCLGKAARSFDTGQRTGELFISYLLPGACFRLSPQHLVAG